MCLISWKSAKNFVNFTLPTLPDVFKNLIHSSMKTRTLLLACLLMGIAVSQLSAQNGKNGTGAVSGFDVWDGYSIDVPVECNDLAVDRLVGKVDFHFVLFNKLGEFTGANVWYSGEVKSDVTNEVFSVSDHWRFDFANMPGSGHFNLKGDLGTHYIVFYTFDFESEQFTFVKAICP